MSMDWWSYELLSFWIRYWSSFRLSLFSHSLPQLSTPKPALVCLTGLTNSGNILLFSNSPLLTLFVFISLMFAFPCMMCLSACVVSDSYFMVHNLFSSTQLSTVHDAFFKKISRDFARMILRKMNFAISLHWQTVHTNAIDSLSMHVCCHSLGLYCLKRRDWYF